MSSALLAVSFLLTILQGAFGFAANQLASVNPIAGSALATATTATTIHTAAVQSDLVAQSPIGYEQNCQIRNVQSTGSSADSWTAELSVEGSAYRAVFGYGFSPFDGKCVLRTDSYIYATWYTVKQGALDFGVFYGSPPR